MSAERPQAELEQAALELEAAQRKVADLAHQVATAKRMRETLPEAAAPLSPMAAAMVAALRYTEDNRERVDVGGLEHRPIGS